MEQTNHPHRDHPQSGEGRLESRKISNLLGAWRLARDFFASSLAIKLPAIVISLLMLAFLVSTFLSVRASRTALTDHLQESLGEQSQSEADLIRSRLIWTRSLAVDLASLAGAVDQNQENLNKIIESTLANNEQVFGSTIAYEPYRFQPDLYYWSPYYSRSSDGSLRFTQLGNPDYNYFQWEWYTLPKDQGAPVLSPPYYDAGGGEIWMVTWSVPFFDSEGKFRGVATADIAFSQTQEIVRQIAVGRQGYAFLVDRQGTLLGIGEQGGDYEIMVDSMLGGDKPTQSPNWTSLVKAMTAGKTGFADATDPNGQSVFVAYQPIGLDTGWSLGLAFPQDELFQPATDLRNTLVAFALLVAIVFAGILFLYTQTITSPLKKLTLYATTLSQEGLEKGHAVIPVEIHTRDELERLASAFNQMARDLGNAFENLDAKVASRTHHLQLAAEVGRSVSHVRDLESMLKEAAEIIRARFDLYYVQVYLANPSQTTLLLQSGTGTVGAELVGRGHSLPIDAASINGRAAVAKRSVVISDTASSATFRPNPLLPDTRSEMAVPLMIGEKVVGVLDMQSRQPGALSQELLPAFEALAGQLAIAIQNAELLAETEQARSEVEKQVGNLARANWNQYLDAIHKPETLGFKFEKGQVLPLDETQVDLPAGEDTLTAPIAIAGEALGSITLEMEGETRNSNQTELVQIVARQVSQQIENLRLLESAERYRAEAEQASRRLTHAGWKDYVESKGPESLGYRYDLKEVHPHNDASLPTAPDALHMPLKVRDETVGRLSVEGVSSDDLESVGLMNAVAERLGAHIESLRQFDLTQSALAQSEKLFEASRNLTQASDLQGLVQAIAETLNIPAVNRAILATIAYNPANELEGGTVAANWWNGVGTQADTVGTYYSMEALKVISFFLSETPVFFNDVFKDERVDAGTLQIAKSQNVRTAAALPLFLGTRQVGTLLLEGEEPHNFTQDEIRLFSALAPQIATVLENRRQFEQAQKQAERESALNIISQKIQGATSVEAVLQIAARELGHALGAPLTIAQLGVKDGK